MGSFLLNDGHLRASFECIVPFQFGLTFIFYVYFQCHLLTRFQLGDLWQAYLFLVCSLLTVNDQRIETF